MKKILFSLLCLFAAVGVEAQAPSRLQGINQPKAGQKISFDYTNNDGPIAGRDTLSAAIYMYQDYVWTVDDVTLRKTSKNQWKGEYQLPDDCAFFALSMRVGDINNRISDNNDENGGYVYMTSKADGTALPGGYAAFATFRCPKLYYVTNYYTNFSISDEAEMMWLNKEVQNYQDRMPDFIDLYLKNIQLMAGKNYDKAIVHFFDMAKGQFPDNEFILNTFENEYRFQAKNEAKADSIRNAMYRLFPNGNACMFRDFQKYQSIPDVTAADSIEHFFVKYPQEACKKSKHFSSQNYMYYNLSRVYCQLLFDGKQYDRLTKHLPMFDFKALSECYRWNIFRNFRMHFVGNDTIYSVAKPLMDLLIEKRQDRSTMDGIYRTPSEAQLMADYQFYEHLGTHIKLLNEMKRYEEAYGYLKYFDNEEMAYSNASVNEARYQVLKALGKKDEALNALKAGVKYNAMTNELLDELRQQSGCKTNADFLRYMDSLKSSKAKNAFEEEVRANMMNVDIPNFTLTDSQGKQVSMASYKNKIVVIDFWANWCAPCKAAMEGMKLAVDKYADDKDVVILFVNTQDRGYAGSKALTEKFMKAKGYDNFNVMYDNKKPNGKEYSAGFSIFAKLFNSSGIPRKVIIRNGKLLYTAEGYSGSPSQLCDEISYAVEMIRKAK